MRQADMDRIVYLSMLAILTGVLCAIVISVIVFIIKKFLGL